jgi:MtN3 and saliva related transmembrane protein
MFDALAETDALGLVAAFFTTCAFVPQSIKILRGGDISGISVAMYVMFVIGLVLWIIYGVTKSDVAIVSANVVTLALALPILIKLLTKRRFGTQ